MTTSTQRAIAKGELLIGRQLGVGGSTWTVRRGADGVTRPAAPAAIGTWAGYVVEERAASAAPTAPGPVAAAKPYAAVGATSTITLTAGGTSELRAGDVLESVATPSWRFLVVSPDRVEGYARYQLEAK
jgi:hypothetical protein